MTHYAYFSRKWIQHCWTTSRFGVWNSTEFTSNSLATVTNVLSQLSKLNITIGHQKILSSGEFPAWVGLAYRRILQDEAITPKVMVASQGRARGLPDDRWGGAQDAGEEQLKVHNRRLGGDVCRERDDVQMGRTRPWYRGALATAPRSRRSTPRPSVRRNFHPSIFSRLLSSRIIIDELLSRDFDLVPFFSPCMSTSFL